MIAMESKGLHCTEQMVSTLRSRDDKLCADAATEIEWLHEYIKKLERRIRNQRAANRTTWEIVEQRRKWLGSLHIYHRYVSLSRNFREYVKRNHA